MYQVKYLNSKAQHSATSQHSSLDEAQTIAQSWLDCERVDCELAEITHYSSMESEVITTLYG